MNLEQQIQNIPNNTAITIITNHYPDINYTQYRLFNLTHQQRQTIDNLNQGDQSYIGIAETTEELAELLNQIGEHNQH